MRLEFGGEANNNRSATTRKLRKRNAEQAGNSERSGRKKQSLGPTVVYELRDFEVTDDLSIMRKEASALGAAGGGLGSSRRPRKGF